MVKIKNNLYIGNMNDFEDIRDSKGWSALHCCKDPYHKELVGYNSNLHPTHPNYAYCISGNRMALNLVDSNRYDPRYLEFNYNMFLKAFSFIDKQLFYEQNTLVHCNQGVSRSPMIMLMYLAYKCIDGYDKLSFEEAVSKFSKDYKYRVSPNGNMYITTRTLWDRFTS